MGGGAVLRSISRVIGGGGTASGRAVVGTALHSPAQKMRISSSHTMVDDWEFAGEEEQFQAPPQAVLDDHRHVRDRLIFGSVPTQQEVLEATSDLQDAIKQTITPVSSTFGHEKLSSSFPSVHDEVDCVEVSGIPETEGESYENSVVGCGPDLDQDKVVQKYVHSNVLDAFHLLQSNPAIQGMVVSLASDKAIWDAFLSNPKVQEFRQSLVEGESELVDRNEDADKKSPLIEAMENMKLRVIQYMEKIKELCNQLFGYVDNKFLEKDADFVEKALEASLMLCFTVLLIVLVKRA
ncbi:hypothetical protein SUGI_0656890 [Cryptomeria japonica]|uniref:uncharacterized protein LOC131048621 isoform X2 n=1 Tax=Cryptomeria japonica TaxID=3369 RepID=UPI002414A368|nr:uncharacterized protein LOC131048621 isoform X2 [Cryptomeria japonica]GLJ32649.1 hypothetical protein SUGI_0656890 [Cryptomeria japonica]